MKVSLLDKIPSSGSIIERHYDKSEKTNTWVLFDDENGNRWVGVFGNSELAHYSDAVIFDNDDGLALIVATGQGYIINTHSGELIRKTPWDYSYSAWKIPEHNYILVADTRDIWACYKDKDVLVKIRTRFGPYALFGTVALDGILFREITSNKLIGYAWQAPYWNEFKIHLDDLILEYIKEDIDEDLSAIPGKGGFPTSESYFNWMRKYWL